MEPVDSSNLATLTMNFNPVDALIRQRKIEEVLDMVDEVLLVKHHGFTKSEVDALRGIWKKLSQRRINRKR